MLKQIYRSQKSNLVLRGLQSDQHVFTKNTIIYFKVLADL